MRPVDRGDYRTVDLSGEKEPEKEGRLAIEDSREIGVQAAEWTLGQKLDADAEVAVFGTETDCPHDQGDPSLYVELAPWPPEKNPNRRWNKRLWKKEIRLRAEDPGRVFMCWH